MAFQNTRYRLGYGILALIIVALVAYLLLNSKPPSTSQPAQTATTTVQDELTQTYASSTLGFSIRYPEGYTVNDKYTYQHSGTVNNIAGVKFMIPKSLAADTNLSDDTYVSIEKVPLGQPGCSADIFLPSTPGLLPVLTDENGTQYSTASTTGAAAGNRYEETVFALVGTNPCIAVRYYIHYGVIDNYPPGTVKEFDKAALLAKFDAIRRSLVIAQ